MDNKKLKKYITTFNTQTWDNKKDSLFSGYWSTSHKHHENISEKKILNYHWSNKSKLINDYEYLRKVYDQTLNKLVGVLNKHHKVDFTVKSWSILLSPWLISILSILFDKFETIKLALKKNKKYQTKILQYADEDFSSINYKDYIRNKITNDDWHHLIFTDLILKTFPENFVIKQIDKKVKIDKNYGYLTFKEKFLKFFSFKLFLKKSIFFLDTSHIKFIDVIKLMLNLNQFPFWISGFDETRCLTQKNINLALRTKLNNELESNTKDQFEIYLEQNIFNYLPMSCLENFNKYQIEAKKFSFKGQKIISRGAQLSNDLYKHWSIIQAEKGVKHHISFHGGGIPLKDINFGYEYKTFEKIIVHHKPFHKKQIKLPVLNFNKKIEYNSNSRDILVVFKPSNSKYLTRLDYCPNGPEDLEDFNILLKFAKKVNKKFQKQIKFRFFNDNWNFNDRLKIFKKDENKIYIDSLNKTKILVSSYLLTPFSEAIAGNIPSVCLLNKEKWIFNEKFKPLFDEMKRNKLIFFSEKECAKHVNENYSNILSWWSSEKVKTIVEKYLENIFYIENEEKLSIWSDYIKKGKNK